MTNQEKYNFIFKNMNKTLRKRGGTTIRRRAKKAFYSNDVKKFRNYLTQPDLIGVVNAENIFNFFDIAIQKGMMDIVNMFVNDYKIFNYLPKNFHDNDFLISACISNNVEILKIFITDEEVLKNLRAQENSITKWMIYFDCVNTFQYIFENVLDFNDYSDESIRYFLEEIATIRKSENVLDYLSTKIDEKFFNTEELKPYFIKNQLHNNIIQQQTKKVFKL